MAGGGRCSRRRTRIRRHHEGAKLGGRGGENDGIVVKPGSRSCGEWICVRGHRIRLLGRMRVDAKGDIYVPDSEDEESFMEGADCRDASVPADGVRMAVVEVPTDAIAVGADVVSRDGFNVAAQGVPADVVEVAAEEGAADGVKVAADMLATEEDMQPEVAARLKTVLAQIDPTFHDVFVSMYKIMVPAFFNP